VEPTEKYRSPGGDLESLRVGGEHYSGNQGCSDDATTAVDWFLTHLVILEYRIFYTF
jgi:hypothetical protein